MSLAKSYDLMNINRISIGKMALEFLHNFNFKGIPTSSESESKSNVALEGLH